MSLISDLNDNPLTGGQIAVELSASQTAAIRVECRAGYKLRGSVSSELAIEARRVGDAGTWTNLETDSVDLSAYAGTRQDFNIRITSNGVTAPLRVVINITVSL